MMRWVLGRPFFAKNTDLLFSPFKIVILTLGRYLELV